jgi:hypothetical protein
VVTEVFYEPGAVRYRTFDDAGEEVLRLSFAPVGVVADGRTSSRTDGSPGWSFDPATGVLRVRREDARLVVIE